MEMIGAIHSVRSAGSGIAALQVADFQTDFRFCIPMVAQMTVWTDALFRPIYVLPAITV